MDVLLSCSDMLRILAVHIKDNDGVEEDISAVIEKLVKAESDDQEKEASSVEAGTEDLSGETASASALGESPRG